MALLILLPLILFTACGRVTITEIIKLETDTYISSNDYSNHAESPTMRLSKSSEGESRGIVKLPTGKEENLSDELDSLLLNPVTLPVAVFVIWIEILRKLLSCEAVTLNPNNLTDATLQIDVINDFEGGLGGKVGIELLSRSWAQSATWEASHHFSSKGRWTTAGGDIDAGFARIDGTVAGTTLEFNVTNYFKSLISQNETAHYGFLVRAVPATLGSVDLASVQNGSASLRPRLESTYTGNCSGSRPASPIAVTLGQ